MQQDDDLAFALSMQSLGESRVTQEEVLDESTVTLAQEIERLAATYGDRFTQTPSGFKLAFHGCVNVVVEVSLDTMMYLEDEPPQFQVHNIGEELGNADCRELRSLLEDYAEEWMEEQMPILDRLMDAVRDWLFWKTEDSAFAPKPEPAAAKKATNQGGFSDHKAKVEKQQKAAAKEPTKPKPKPTPKPKPVAAPKPRPALVVQPTFQWRPTPTPAPAPAWPPPPPPHPLHPSHLKLAARTRFEALYGKPLSRDFLETWELPAYGGHTPPPRPGLLERPENECDEDILVKIETAYVNETRILNITHTQVSVLPASLMGHLTTLTELNLHHNRLSALPPSIGHISSLTKLYASYNQITEFPAELTNLSNLLNLDLSHNQLITMPPQVDQLSSLQILELNHNQIRGLPPQIGDMQSLRKLYLNNNKIQFVPAELGFLPKLNLLRLDHNPIKNIPADEYRRGTVATLEFLRGSGPSVETGHLLKNFAFAREFSDVEFVVHQPGGDADIIFPAHKVVLCARSPVLRALLHSLQPGDYSHDGGDGGEDRALVQLWPPSELADVSADVFHEFIGYLYRDTVEKDTLKAMGEDLDRVATYYGVERLSEMCRRLKFGYIVVRESSFAQDFGVLMEEPVRYSDVAFIVEGEAIKAHKVFLAASSDYFKGMFTSGLKEAQQDEIDLPHVRADIFRAVREYCYTGDVEEITGDTAVDLLSAASAFSLPRLKMIVESLLGYSLDVDNVACLYPVAVLYAAQVLERACEFFMASNLAQVKTTEAWRDLDPGLRSKVLAQTTKWGLDKATKK